jgi:hypothetical protein
VTVLHLVYSQFILGQSLVALLRCRSKNKLSKITFGGTMFLMGKKNVAMPTRIIQTSAHDQPSPFKASDLQGIWWVAIDKNV